MLPARRLSDLVAAAVSSSIAGGMIWHGRFRRVMSAKTRVMWILTCLAVITRARAIAVVFPILALLMSARKINIGVIFKSGYIDCNIMCNSRDLPVRSFNSGRGIDMFVMFVALGFVLRDSVVCCSCIYGFCS